MKLANAAFTGIGLTLVGVGIVGVFVPGLPTTVFLVMALFCFKQGSPRFESWLLNHRQFGPTLRDWEENRAIKPRTKVIAIATMWAFIILAAFLIANKWIAGGVVALGVYGTWFILTRKSAEQPLSSANRG